MIRGLGTDVVELSRIENGIQQHGRRFSARILSKQELSEFEVFQDKRRVEFLAGRFAAKEAIAKALGCGLANLHMREVNLQLCTEGLIATGAGLENHFIGTKNKIYVSISHSTSIAFAVAIWEGACHGCT